MILSSARAISPSHRDTHGSPLAPVLILDSCTVAVLAVLLGRRVGVFDCHRSHVHAVKRTMSESDRPEWVPENAQQAMVLFQCEGCGCETPQKRDSPIREKVDRGNKPISFCPVCKADEWEQINEWDPETTE